MLTHDDYSLLQFTYGVEFTCDFAAYGQKYNAPHYKLEHNGIYY